MYASVNAPAASNIMHVLCKLVLLKSKSKFMIGPEGIVHGVMIKIKTKRSLKIDWPENTNV